MLLTVPSGFQSCEKQSHNGDDQAQRLQEILVHLKLLTES